MSRRTASLRARHHWLPGRGAPAGSSRRAAQLPAHERRHRAPVGQVPRAGGPALVERPHQPEPAGRIVADAGHRGVGELQADARGGVTRASLISPGAAPRRKTGHPRTSSPGQPQRPDARVLASRHPLRPRNYPFVEVSVGSSRRTLGPSEPVARSVSNAGGVSRMVRARARPSARAEASSTADSRRATPGTASHAAIPERRP